MIEFASSHSHAPGGVCRYAKRRTGRKSLEKLDEAGLRRVLDGITILTRDLAYESFPQRVVDAVATVIPVDFISYNEVSDDGGSRFLLRPDPQDFAPGSFELAAFVRRFGNHPVVAQKVTSSGNASPEVQRFVNRIRLLGMVGNCCGQAELRLNMGLTVARGQARKVGVAVHRSLRDFDDRDAAALDALKPHIVTAWRNAVAHGGAQAPAASPLPATALTARENEVLYWVSMGKTNGEVGEIIGARPMTVKKHLEHIYDKLGVPNRTAAARAAVAGQQRGAPPG
jgi:DNA-binding CsgD family transcriptional regulator